MLEKSSGSCDRLPLPASYTGGHVKTEATGHPVAEPHGLTSSSQSPFFHAPVLALTSFKKPQDYCLDSALLPGVCFHCTGALTQTLLLNSYQRVYSKFLLKLILLGP